MASKKKLGGVFGLIATWVMRSPKQVVLLLTLCSCLSIWLSLQLRVNADLLELLPEDSQVTQDIRRFNAEEGGAHLLQITLLGGEDDVRHQELLRLQSIFSEMEEIDYALYDLPEELKYQLGLLQLRPEELEQINLKLKQATALGPAAASPFLAQQLFSLGPLTDKLNQGSMLGGVFSPKGGGRIIIHPNKLPFDPTFNKPFLEKIYKTLDDANLEEKGIKVGWIGGPYRHAVEDVQQIVNDLARTAGFSLLLVCLVVAVGFRDVRALAVIFLPLVFGSLWTWGLTSLLIGELNAFTSSFTAILLGLGVDFSIHLYSRYREERERQPDLESAVREAWDAAGPPCLAAGLTSAAGFSALCLARFEGFSQLGIILSGGVLLCLIAIVLSLPLMIVWRESLQQQTFVREVSAGDGKQVTYWMAPYGLGILFVLALLSSTKITSIAVDYDMSKLRPEGLAYNELDPDIRKIAERSFNPVLVEFDDPQQLAQAHSQLQKTIEDESEPYFQNLLSIYSVLPTDKDKRFEQLQELSTMTSPEQIKYLPSSVQKNLTRFHETPPRKIDIDQLPKSVLHLVGYSEEKSRLVLLPGGNQWDIRENSGLAVALDEHFPGRVKVGEYLAIADLYRLLKADAPYVGGMALILVLLASLLDIKSIWRAVSAVLILIIGMSWAGAAMVYFGIPLSMFNFVGIPIMIGIGIDVIIHLMHRISEEGPGRIGFALKTTGFAALLSVSTTTFSFSSLFIATNRGVQSLGQLVVVGLILITVAAFSWIPLGWMSMWFRHKTKSKKLKT